MNENRLVPFDRLAKKKLSDKYSNEDFIDYHWYKMAEDIEKAYIKSLKPYDLIKYLEDRNNEEVLERL